jgi:hypothetical protein
VRDDDLGPDDQEGIGDRCAEARRDRDRVSRRSLLARQCDQDEPRRGKSQRGESDSRTPFRQQKRGEHGEEHGRGVDGQDRDRDRRALQRLEEEHPMQSQQKTEA